MARRKTRNRRGRFLKGSSRKSRSRKRRSSSRRRRSPRRSSSRRRARRSNPTQSRHTRRRKQRASYRRRAGPRYAPRRRRSHSRRRHVHHRARRSNPPYGIKDVVLAVAIVGAGFAAAKLLPYAIAHFTGDPSWNQGWHGVGLHGGASVLVAGIGYGITRLISSKRQAAMVGGELLVGGILATGFEAFHMIRRSMGVAPSVQASGGMPALVPAGQRGITPQQIAQAQQAARIIQQRGMGNATPAAYANANQPASALFSANEKF